MSKGNVLKSQKVMKYYTLITLFALIATLLFNLPLIATSSTIKSVAGILILVSLPLLVGLILLIFLNANRNEDLGRKVIRFAWTTLIVITLCFTLMGLGIFLFNLTIGTYSFSIAITIGVCLAALCYMTLSLEEIWTF